MWVRVVDDQRRYPESSQWETMGLTVRRGANHGQPLVGQRAPGRWASSDQSRQLLQINKRSSFAPIAMDPAPSPNCLGVIDMSELPESTETRLTSNHPTQILWGPAPVFMDRKESDQKDCAA